jgi:uncharacterized protein YecA (UPF0149 family)
VQEAWSGVDRDALDPPVAAEIDEALRELWRHVGRRISQPPEVLEERAVPLAHLSDAVVEATQTGTLHELDAVHEAVGVEWAQGFLHGVSMAAEAWYERMEANEQIEFDLADMVELAELGNEDDESDEYEVYDEDDSDPGQQDDDSADDEGLLEAIDIDDFVEQQSRMRPPGSDADSGATGTVVTLPATGGTEGGSRGAGASAAFDVAVSDFELDDEEGDEDDEILEPLTVLDCLDFVSRTPIMLHEMHLLRMQEARPEPAKRDDLPGRNDPCSCGSGKKFKKCCGDPARLH